MIHGALSPGSKGAPSSARGRRGFLAILLGFSVAAGIRPSAAGGSPPRIGWLKIQGPRHSPDQLQAFREGLRERGLVEGRDYLLEQRYADNDATRLRGLARELTRAGVSVIVATSQPSIVAAAQATKAVPVIGRMNDNPVVSGLARSLARPGGNVTGVYALTEHLNAKRLSLLKEALPQLRRVGVLLQPKWSNAEHDWQLMLHAAQELGVELRALSVGSADDITAAFKRASAQAIGGIMTFRNPTVVTYLKLIAELCREHRLPAVFDAREYVEAGGLMSYGPNIDAIYRQLAGYADRLLHGARPGELPIEQPTTFELVINKRTAEAIGVTLPPDLLARADTLID
jgi:putative ABC transport system substrate-binding protein